MLDVARVNQLMAQMTALRNAGQIAGAAEICREITRLVPDSEAAFANLSTMLLDSGDADGSVDAGQRAVVLNPMFYGGHVAMGAALAERGEAAAAVAHFARAIELNPQRPKLHSNKIYAMEFMPGVLPAQLLAEQLQWNRQFGTVPTLCAPGASTPSIAGRKIRIGYVSAFFFHHAEAFFVLPLLENHDRSRFEIHCYADLAFADRVTQRHRNAVDYWHDCAGLSHDQLAMQIHGDRIDILIDLMMHMGRNRAQMFAKKPAPIQVAWLAYPGGTGLSAMDYRITDSLIDPATGPLRTDEFYSEKCIRLPHCWCSYDPLSDAPPVPPRPDRPITFGSLNNPRKLNEPTLRLWAQAMIAVPGSRAIILSISAGQRAAIAKIFNPMGIASDRVEFVGRMHRADYLRQYDRIDITLDTLPYAGITTTCDALWMGVPVVTLAGDTAAGRAGCSVVTAGGLAELAMANETQFISGVARLAELRTLNETRSGLRERVRGSALMDGARFAQEFEAALARMHH